MTKDSPNLTITLTGRRPATITKSEWPIVAMAKEPTAPGEDAMDKLFVRQHRDGRVLVYGIAGNGTRRGRLLEEATDDAAIDTAVRLVGGELGFTDTLINDCLADLPAEAI